jgi:hypothetical protein
MKLQKEKSETCHKLRNQKGMPGVQESAKEILPAADKEYKVSLERNFMASLQDVGLWLSFMMTVFDLTASTGDLQ